MTQEPKQRINTRALVARLSREARALQGREILAPVRQGRRIRTRLGGLVYEFRPQSLFVRWGHFLPLDARTAEPIGEALPWERAAYLELFPLLRVVLLWPDPAGRVPAERVGGTWWALPYNGSDARQRFGLDPFEPLPVHLCDPTDGAERFARVLALVDGRTLLFDGPDPLADPAYTVSRLCRQPHSVHASSLYPWSVSRSSPCVRHNSDRPRHQ